MTVKLVPHIYRQEVYIGEKLVIQEDEEEEEEDEQEKKYGSIEAQLNKTLRAKKTVDVPPMCSPLDFFQPDKENYPLFEEVERRYTVMLHDGDCLFIPAFYLYMFSGRPDTYFESRDTKSTAIALSIRYPTNSMMLDIFYRAIELDIIS